MSILMGRSYGLTDRNMLISLGRPTKVRTAAGHATHESWTRTEYNDVARRVIVRADLETKGDYKKVAIQHYDQLGRVRLARALEDAATEDPTNETHGIKVETRYLPGNPNSYQLTSNPFRAAYASQATNEATMGWTRSKAVNTGRHSEVETFSGAGLPAPWGSNANSTGKVQTDIDANTTTVTDQAGKQRRSITNALGQLTRVDEPDASGQLGSVSSPNQPTNYFYNTLGKMVRVQQGVQNRYFMYDSLGRMLRIKQPEQEVNTALNTTGNADNNSWTAGFAYDNNGNVLTTTDAKRTTITSTYDALNRPLTRVYSNEPQGVSTPAVTNYYDGLGLPSVPQFSKGKLTRVASTISDSRYTEFDQLGRLKQYQQITDGQTYTSGYQYNLSGALIEETYPSGRKVRNEFETDGDLAKVTSQKAGATVYVPYASNISYSAAGAVTSMKMGNGKWETASFNSRLQPVQLGLGASVADTGLWKVNFDYGELLTNGTVDSVKNNGNIAKQTLTVPGTNFVQAYKYDPLNRLTEAKETTGTTQNWIQNWSYDIYGNRTSFNQTIGNTTTNTTPSVNALTNRFNTGQGFGYDANGNVIQDVDSMTTHSRQFTFNGDNKQTQVKDVTNNNQVVGTYYYDGEGKRVKKVTDTETTVFIYSLGRIVAEYSTQLSSSPSVNYTTTDHLGSPRIITDQLGQVKARRDFMPFGEDIYVGVGARSTTLNYGSSNDDVRQKFTGYQKDSETSLDFAEARMYENRFGRFTAIDPLLASGKSANPQTFNRFLYVRNNPINLIDPSGLCDAPAGLKPGQVGICFEAFIKASRIGPGGIGHGDGRTFSGDDASLTARVTVWAIVSTDENTYSAVKSGEKIGPSLVGNDNKNAEPDVPLQSPIALQGKADTNVTATNNGMVKGEKDFGAKGLDVTVSIANGTNGGQQLGKDLQAAGTVVAGTVNPVAGAVVAGAGKVAEAVSPAGTIDGSATLRITGNGNVSFVSGETRQYPSYAVYAYTKDASGNTRIVFQRTREETPPIENLTKPKTAW
ncbi:MAG: RHS repeat domain-containing protein [Pyrinomonadaceae bacterium]